MCGIAGFIDPALPQEEARAWLDRMLALIVHRGPDGSGTHVATPLAIGMRRLSIIDLEGGAQPIWNEDKTIGVVFNGEIYNYRELTAELQAAGHVFRTRSDTEVLVHLYEEHGDALFSKLRGMFAFALLDTRRRRVLLARDHFGQKPLYLTRDAGGRFAFASELKSLLALPWVDRELDGDALGVYACWLSLPPPRTHFRRIEKLRAGHFLALDLDDPAAAVPQKFWSYDLASPPDCTDMDAAAETLDATLRDSVALHLRADVPVGVLLSSGLDSRVIAAYTQELHPANLQTFTVGFGGSESELPGAAKTAHEIGSTHHSLELTAADLGDSIGKIAWHLDEPVGDPAAFAVWKICTLARDHVKVLLSGEGADELFAGYDGRYLGMLATLARSEWLRPLSRLLPQHDAAARQTRWQRMLSRVHSSRSVEIVALRREGFPGDPHHPRGLTGSQLRGLRAKKSALADAVCRPQRDVLSELLAFDLDWQLAESLLQKADKMSMAASIELRTPLLDLRVAELAARMDSSLKLPPGGPGKLVLRRCLSRKLNEPLDRPKRGFPVPLASWLRGPLREQCEATLFASGATCFAHLDRAAVRSAWDQFQRSEWDGAQVFYALWLYETWARSVPAAART
ncbi:MAG: asparagine synthase (glutamine-hydrolyzing) [Chthoniobacteraceae bacterium]